MFSSSVHQSRGRVYGWARAGRWAGGILGMLTLGAAALLALGVAAVTWVPLVVVVGVAMCAVWVARRRRQCREGRDAREIKDAAHADPVWDEQELIDDRLPDRPMRTTLERAPSTPDHHR